MINKTDLLLVLYKFLENHPIELYNVETERTTRPYNWAIRDIINIVKNFKEE